MTQLVKNLKNNHNEVVSTTIGYFILIASVIIRYTEWTDIEMTKKEFISGLIIGILLIGTNPKVLAKWLRDLISQILTKSKTEE